MICSSCQSCFQSLDVTHVMLLVLMALTVLTSLSLLVFTADAVWKLDTLTTGLLLFVVLTVTFVDGELQVYKN